MGVVQLGGLSAGSSVRSTNTAICSRVAGERGQYSVAEHPATTPRLASSSTQRQKGLVTGTSENIGTAPHGGGAYPGGSFATSTNTAMASRLVEASGQYAVAVQPPVTPRWSRVSTKR